MANVELPNLPAAVSVLDSDLLHIRQGAEDKKATVTTLQDNLNTVYLRKDDNLSSVSSVVDARSNLGVYSTSESDARYLLESNNLSDLTNATTARNNLGLGSMATKNSGTSGSSFRTNDQNDERFCLESNNLSDIANPATAFNNIKQSATLSNSGVVQLANTLSSTSTSQALTAAMGKTLSDKFGEDYVFAPVGDFASGGFKLSRAGSQVTISTVITTLGLSHDSKAGPSAGQVIPAAFRPAQDAYNCYYNVFGDIRTVLVKSSGDLTFFYSNSSGDPSARTSTGSFTISYTI